MLKWACPRSAGARLSTRETGNEASQLRCPAVCDDLLPKHEGLGTMENPVSMSSGDSLQDWSSDSISSHQTQVRSPAVQKLQLQLAQALIALSLINYIILLFFLLGM